MAQTSYDAIVVGLGAMGSAACYQLAKAGCRVLGLDQFEVGHSRGSSHGETRIIRRAYFEDPSYVPLLNRAYELWHELEREVDETILVPCGLVIYGNPQSSMTYKGTLKSAQTYSVPVEELSREQALKRFPMYRPLEDQQAVFEPGAGFLHAERAVFAHARAAQERGAVLKQNERILSFQDTGKSVIVRTDAGTYEAAKLVLTAGSWTSQLLSDLGLPLKIHRKILYWFEAAVSHQLERGVPCFLFHNEDDYYYGFPMLDGRTIKLASHLANDPLEDPADKELTGKLSEERLVPAQNFIARCLPHVRQKLDHFSTCIYTMTPDENFIIDTHPEAKNIVFACGFSGHGFKFSSVVGEILKELAFEGKSRQPIEFLKLR